MKIYKCFATQVLRETWFYKARKHVAWLHSLKSFVPLLSLSLNTCNKVESRKEKYFLVQRRDFYIEENVFFSTRLSVVCGIATRSNLFLYRVECGPTEKCFHKQISWQTEVTIKCEKRSKILNKFYELA